MDTSYLEFVAARRKMRALSIAVLAAICLAVAAEKKGVGIVGGSVTSIGSYPYVASMLYAPDLVFYQQTCVGAILNSRTVLSNARCFDDLWIQPPVMKDYWRIRVGSSFANSGGSVNIVERLIIHYDYDPIFHFADLSLLRSASTFTFSDTVRAGSIAGPNYVVSDNQELWTVGWGRSSMNATASEEMRRIRLRYMNRSSCMDIYRPLEIFVNSDLMCSNLAVDNNRNECQGLQGSPIIHNNVIVGLTSVGLQCERSGYPGVGTRVSQFTQWIVQNA